MLGPQQITSLLCPPRIFRHWHHQHEHYTPPYPTIPTTIPHYLHHNHFQLWLSKVSSRRMEYTNAADVSGVVKQPTLFLSDSGHGRPVKPSLFKTTASTPSAVVEAAVRRFMSPDAKPIFQRHWEEAKRRLGPWQAGLTLRSFIERNTKVPINR